MESIGPLPENPEENVDLRRRREFHAINPRGQQLTNGLRSPSYSRMFPPGRFTSFTCSALRRSTGPSPCFRSLANNAGKPASIFLCLANPFVATCFPLGLIFRGRLFRFQLTLDRDRSHDRFNARSDNPFRS